MASESWRRVDRTESGDKRCGSEADVGRNQLVSEMGTERMGVVKHVTYVEGARVERTCEVLLRLVREASDLVGIGRSVGSKIASPNIATTISGAKTDGGRKSRR